MYSLLNWLNNNLVDLFSYHFNYDRASILRKCKEKIMPIMCVITKERKNYSLDDQMSMFTTKYIILWHFQEYRRTLESLRHVLKVLQQMGSAKEGHIQVIYYFENFGGLNFSNLMLNCILSSKIIKVIW